MISNCANIDHYDNNTLYKEMNNPAIRRNETNNLFVLDIKDLSGINNKFGHSAEFRLILAEDYTLFQLHLLISALFDLDLSKNSYTTHIFLQERSQFFNSSITKNSDECLPKVIESENITYQTIQPEDCEGWLTLIGPNTYIEHTHPHEPKPILNIRKKINSNKAIENEIEGIMAIREMRDERAFKLKNVFETNKTLKYLNENGYMPFLEIGNYEINLIKKLNVTKRLSIEHIPQIINITNIKNKDQLQVVYQDKINQLDAFFNNTTCNNSTSSCYMCKIEDNQCNPVSFAKECGYYSGLPCCDMCLYNVGFSFNDNNTNWDIYQQYLDNTSTNHIDLDIQYYNTVNFLLIERLRFLRNSQEEHNEGSFRCTWEEYNGDACAYCSEY